MKFFAGLLIGAIATLAAATVADYQWQPPSRLAQPAVAAAQISNDVLPKVAAEQDQQAQQDQHAEQESAQTPLRSVTIAPLPPLAADEPAPTAALPGGVEPDPAPASASASVAVETAVIWKPFHSEVSATGFARRLSTQLGYPFRALRDGPARYHVVFDYDTEQQRELLRSQVTALTGFEAI